ncbi:mannosyltransferase family protein [Sphaerisporangium perillae]|uniref:mannosyltransferase family protein n=1 Tax=Sphaerisporangium perillae TaxID=2935860 RepID=UPI00200D204A|nr:mannosyltransferase family protein [Sphaerisporangium perillae]
MLEHTSPHERAETATPGQEPDGPGDSTATATADPGAGAPAPSPDEPSGIIGRRRWTPRFLSDAGDRQALLIWFCSHVGFLIYTYLAAPGRTTDPFLNRLTRWDAENFIAIAEFGYDGPPGMQDSAKLPAFFPGMAMLIKLMKPVVHDGRLATVIISLVACAVVAVALSRLAESYAKGSGRFAVAALFLSPFAAFLYTGYSESLFLALAICAWLLARNGRWDDAALCATAATVVRISGLFLALGLLIMFLVAANGRKAPGGWRALPWLALPGVPIVLYTVFQWTRTGDWLAYNTVQDRFWGRHAVWPWEAFLNTWNMSDDVPTLTMSYYEEMIAAAVLLVLAICLAVRRRWPELAYIAPQVLSFLTLSSFYLSIGRASLTWFPLWVALGVAGVRRPWVWYVSMAVMVPVMAINVGNFTTGAWIG